MNAEEYIDSAIADMDSKPSSSERAAAIAKIEKHTEELRRALRKPRNPVELSLHNMSGNWSWKLAEAEYSSYSGEISFERWKQLDWGIGPSFDEALQKGRTALNALLDQ